MTTPATKPTRKRAAAKSATVTPISSKRASKRAAAEPKPATKRSTKSAAVEAKPEPKATPAPKGLSDEQQHELAQLHGQMVNATAAFEAAVVSLLSAGASPSHVGAACSLGNSSIRRIGWRHGVGTPPPAQQR